MKEIFSGIVFQIGDEIKKKNITLFEVQGKIFEVSEDQKVDEKKYMQTNLSNTDDTHIDKQISNNELRDVINAIKNDKTRTEIINDVIKQYHTNVSYSSLETYYANYVKYIREKNLVASIFFPIPRGKANGKKNKKRKHYRPKNVECVGFSKTYQIWIRTEWYLKVKRALNKYGFVPTVVNIANETGITEGRIRATLDYMRNKGKKEAYRATDSNGQFVYKLV